jgi:hypothetical protein
MTGIIANLLPEALRVFIDPGHFVMQNRHLASVAESAQDAAREAENFRFEQAYAAGQLNALRDVQRISEAEAYQKYMRRGKVDTFIPLLEEKIALDPPVSAIEPLTAPDDPLLRWGINVPYYAGLGLGAGTIINNEQEKQAILQRQRLMASRNYPMY